MFALVIIVMTLASVSAKADIVGRARIVDGDTLEIAGTKIRMHGIDAPESKQTCQANGKTYQCGQTATIALGKLIGSSHVRCQGTDRDRYGRMIAVCFVGQTNLNASLVSQGWALAYRRYSMEFVGTEAAAKRNKRGMWAGSFIAPWDWRKGVRLAATD